MQGLGIVRLLLCAALLAAGSAGAHHSVNAFFNQSTITELEGTITGVQWRNPHVGFLLQVSADGNDEEWQLISSSINSLERSGLTPDMFRIGDEVRVAGWPDRRGRNGLFITNFLMANGVEARMTATNPQPLRWTEPRETPRPGAVADDNAPAGDASIFRVWVRAEAYRARRPLRFTPAALAARAQWDPLADDPSLDCVPPGMSNAILNPYPIEFIDEGDTIRLRLEEWQSTRIIHMNTGADPRDVPPSPLGYSTGRWEGDSLVITTTRVNWPYLDGDGTPQSENVVMVERFTVSDDGARLDFELTVTDSANLIEPAIWDAVWVWDPRIEIKPYECIDAYR